MEKSQLPQGISLSNHHKDSVLSKPTTKTAVFLSLDLDTHLVFVEESPLSRKTEANPIGYFVRFFDTMAKALHVKALIDKKPYLAFKYLNIHRSC